MCDPCLKELIRRPEDLARQAVVLHEATYLCTPHTTSKQAAHAPSMAGSQADTVFISYSVPPWRGDYLRGQYYLEPELVKTSDLLFKLAKLDQTDPLPESTTCTTIEQILPTDIPPAPTTTSAPTPARGQANPPTATVAPATAPASPGPPTPASFDPRTRVGKYVKEWVGDTGENVVGRMELAMKDAEALTQWQARLEDSRRAARTDHKTVRIHEITRHLREEGFEDVDITPTVGPFSKVLKEVEQPYPLTDRVWRKIKEPVIREAHRFRELRLNPHPPDAALAPQELPPTIMVEPAVLQQFGVVGGRVMVQARAPGVGVGTAAPLLGGGFSATGAYWTAGLNLAGAGQAAGHHHAHTQAQAQAQAHVVHHAQRQGPSSYGQQSRANPTAPQPRNGQNGFASAQQQGRNQSHAAMYYQQLQQQQAMLVARSQQLRQQQPQQPLLGQDLIRALLAQHASAGPNQLHQAHVQPGQQHQQQHQHRSQQHPQPLQHPATALLQRPAQSAIRQQSAPPHPPVDHMALLNPLLAPQPASRPAHPPAPSSAGQGTQPPPLIPIPGCGPAQGNSAFATSGLRAPLLGARAASQDQVPTQAGYAQAGSAQAFGGASGRGQGQGQGVYDARGRPVARFAGAVPGQAHLLGEWGQVRRPASAPPPLEGVRRG